MCLRITDKLFDQLLNYLDIIENNSTMDLSKRTFLKRLYDFLENDCKVKKPIRFNEKKQRITIASLNQNNRLKILKQLENRDIVAIFPEFLRDDKVLLLNYVIVEFFKIFNFIKKNHSEYFDEDSLKIRLS